MNITLTKAALKIALDTLSAILDRKPLLPIYGCVLIETFHNRLRLTVEAHDPLMRRVELYADADVTTAGKVCVSLKALKAGLNKCKKGTVTLIHSTHRCIDTGKERGALELYQNGLEVWHAAIQNVSTFPSPIPIQGKTPRCFTVDAGALQQAIGNTVYAAAKEDNRPILTGVYMGAMPNEDTITLAAADGYRLGVAYAPVVLSSKEGFECVIPARSAKLLQALLKTSSAQMSVMIIIDTTNNRALLNWGDVMITLALLEGRFPDFRTVIADTYATTAIVDPREWMAALKPLEAFAKEDANSIKHIFKDGMLIMSTKGYEGEVCVPLLGLEGERIIYIDYVLLKEVLSHQGECVSVSLAEHKLCFVPSAKRQAYSVLMAMCR